MKLDYTGKNVVITGGTAGMGFAAAKAFADSGAAVYLCGRREEKVLQTVEQLRQGGGQAWGTVCDVSKEKQVRQLGAWVKELTGGRVDVWVNNAGGMLRGDLVQQDTPSMEQLFEQNAFSVLWGSQEAAALMSEGGVIINAGSYSGGKPSVNQGIYSATKAVVHSFTATLANELAPRGIRVVAYAPGSIYTEMTHPSALTNMAMLRRIPCQRMGKPEEVASLILFLASEQAAYINGICVPIDGGKLTTQAPEAAWA